MSSYMPYIWIGIAVVMAVIETSTVQLVSVWFVIGALCAALASIFTDNIVIQTVVFVAVSLVALVITRPLVQKFKKNNKKTNTNADRVIGETGVMLSDISEIDDIARVKVRGEVWSAKTDNPPLEKGDRVRVLAIEGVKLIVEKTD